MGGYYSTEELAKSNSVASPRLLVLRWKQNYSRINSQERKEIAKQLAEYILSIGELSEEILEGLSQMEIKLMMNEIESEKTKIKFAHSFLSRVVKN